MKILSLCLVTVLAAFAISTSAASSPSQPAAIDQPAACEADALAAGGSCGGVTCGKNQHCCNASCGWCVPVGMECPQIACAIGAPDPDDTSL